MSFSVHARRVRDPNLPLHRRVSALSSCVQSHQPFGFHGTLAYLELECGPFRDDEQALLRALEVLEDLRERWKAEVAAYAEIRRAEKRAGRRVPDPRAANPHARPRWGSRAISAKYQLRLWADRATDSPVDPLETKVRQCVRACVQDAFGAEERALLGTCLGALDRRLAQSTSRNEYRRWHNLLTVARLVDQATAATGETSSP